MLLSGENKIIYRIDIKKIISLIGVFAIGFGYYLPIPFILLLLLAILFYFNYSFKPKFSNIGLYLLLSSAIFSLWLINYLISNNINALKNAVIELSVITLLYVIILFRTCNVSLLLTTLMQSILIYSCIVCFYSYVNGYLGYGDLFDPIINNSTNSSSINNILIVPFIYYFILMLQTNSIPLKIISLINVTICILIGLYLKGRIFLYLFFINFFIILLFKPISKIIIFLLVILLLFIFYMKLITDPILIDRLSLGLTSNRFLHFDNFLVNFQNYPFGGIPVNIDIEDTNWYHNIFFDTYKISGILPTLLLMLYVFYTFCLLYKNIKSNGFTFYSILVFNIFIIFQLDVIVEGSINLLFIFFTLSIILNDKNNSKLFFLKNFK